MMTRAPLPDTNAVSDVTACVTFHDRERPITFGLSQMETFSQGRIRLTNAESCPHAYSQMSAEADANGQRVMPPAGYVDPLVVKFLEVNRWNRDVIFLRAHTMKGATEYLQFCEARTIDSRWSASCSIGEIHLH